MIGRIISMFAGSAIAKSAGGAGPMGAVVGAALPTVMRRMGPLGMVAAAAGAYALSKYVKRQQAAPKLPSTGGPPFNPPG